MLRIQEKEMYGAEQQGRQRGPRRVEGKDELGASLDRTPGKESHR